MSCSCVPETGYYGIRVDFTGTSFDQVGITSANYGLAWSGIEGVLVLNPAVIPELLLLIGLCFLKRRRSTEFSLA